MKATFALLTFVLLLAVSGCNRSGVKAASRASNTSAQWSDDLFKFAIANLNHLEDNDCMEMMHSTQERLTALSRPEMFPGVLPANNLLASWPEPDMLRQVVSRLNQWVDTLDKPKPWTPDPMLAKLPPKLAKLPMIVELDQPHFSSYDGYMLMEAVWARDLTRWAKGNSSDDFSAARNLFDWTIRNIQLDPDGPNHVPQIPWETLFLGHGTAMERAWTYILLLRQCDIDAAVLAIPASDPAAKDTNAELKAWCVAVLLGDKVKKLYLFEPRLGLPIPAPKGITLGKSGQLEIQPATFDQLIADPKLLDQLALASEGPYWVKSADLKRAVAMVEASPLYLEPRAKRVESTLAGERKLVLSTDPTQQAARFKTAGLADVQLWDLPYTTLDRRINMPSLTVFARLQSFLRFIGFGSGSLYKGRILHLKGRFFDEKGAIDYYQKARPRARDVTAEESKKAQEFYAFRVAQFKERGIPETPEMQAYLKREITTIARMEVAEILQGKVDAAYWLGLIEYEQDQFESALDYFQIRTLQAGPDVSWAPAARYNMGRSYEASGRWSEAVEEYQWPLYVRDEKGKTVHATSLETGSRIRAKWLHDFHSAKPVDDKKIEKKPEEKKTSDKKGDEKMPEVTRPAEKKGEEKKP